MTLSSSLPDTKHRLLPKDKEPIDSISFSKEIEKSIRKTLIDIDEVIDSNTATKCQKDKLENGSNPNTLFVDLLNDEEEKHKQKEKLERRRLEESIEEEIQKTKFNPWKTVLQNLEDNKFEDEQLVSLVYDVNSNCVKTYMTRENNSSGVIYK